MVRRTVDLSAYHAKLPPMVAPHAAWPILHVLHSQPWHRRSSPVGEVAHSANYEHVDEFLGRACMGTDRGGEAARCMLMKHAVLILPSSLLRPAPIDSVYNCNLAVTTRPACDPTIGGA